MTAEELCNEHFKGLESIKRKDVINLLQHFAIVKNKLQKENEELKEEIRQLKYCNYGNNKKIHTIPTKF